MCSFEGVHLLEKQSHQSLQFLVQVGYQLSTPKLVPNFITLETAGCGGAFEACNNWTALQAEDTMKGFKLKLLSLCF
jgi:hypothetical protein